MRSPRLILCLVLLLGGSIAGTAAATPQEEVIRRPPRPPQAEMIREWPEQPRWSKEAPLLEQIEAPPADIAATLSIAAAVPGPGRDGLSGLFLIDAGGRILFRPTPGTGPSPVPPIDHFDQPGGLAYLDPLLYVYDQASRRLWTVDLRRPDDPPVPLELGARFREPTSLAVSPHGLIAVMDRGELLFLQEGRAPVRYPRRRFEDPAGLEFASWDTLHLLDRSQRSLVTITLVRQKDGSVEFLSESEVDLTPFEEPDWRVMTVLEGTPYLVSRTMVYAYLAADRLLLPVLPLHPEHQRVHQAAVTRELLYLLDDDHLDISPRPQPVDLALEASPAKSQAALVAFYRYLFDRDMLPVRRIHVPRDESLEGLLLRERVLIAPPSLGAEDPVRVLDRTAQRRVPARVEPPEAGAGFDGGLGELLCELNPELCARSPGFVHEPLAPGSALVVPDLHIRSRLARERILLEAQPLESYLERLVFDPEFARRSRDPELIRRLNPNLEDATDAEILHLTRGAVVVPVEQWTITAAVPEEDYAAPDSPLWHLAADFDRVSVFSREAYVELALRSADAAQPPPPPDPPDPAPDDLAAACEELRDQRDRWFQAIHYPTRPGDGGAVWPPLEEASVLVGVLEKGSTVIRTHQAFALDPDRPTWHTARDLVLTAEPVPASLDVSNQVVEDLTTYSAEAHHGTHVAGLIAGRPGECWSGLTPSARLVLVELTDSSDLRTAILDAANVDVHVFNVSQEFAADREDLHRTIRDSPRTLFVGAAGNSTLDLDAALTVKLPALLGQAPNVVVVAASDWDGTLLPRVHTPEGTREGSNFGKEYVDLVAPGEDLVSATAQRRYGPATGTSQAAPQVAAAAALLVDRWKVVVGDTAYTSPQLDPGDAKARLIATARWRDDYEGKVWGGMLDFGAAVLFPDLNRLETTTGELLGELYAFTPANNPRIVVTNAPRYYERSGPGAIMEPNKKIPFSHILSLQRLPSGRHRLVFREQVTNRLKIVLDAALEDDQTALRNRPIRIECSSFSVFDPETGTFERDDARCAEGISVTQIEEYVLGERYLIDWETQP